MIQQPSRSSTRSPFETAKGVWRVRNISKRPCHKQDTQYTYIHIACVCIWEAECWRINTECITVYSLRSVYIIFSELCISKRQIDLTTRSKKDSNQVFLYRLICNARYLLLYNFTSTLFYITLYSIVCFMIYNQLINCKINTDKKREYNLIRKFINQIQLSTTIIYQKIII